jgi:type IV pilus assembly protein PilC
MGVFFYKAMDDRAAAVAGTIVADSPRQAREQLRARGLSIREIRPGESRLSQNRLVAGIFNARNKHRAQLVGFIRELSTMLAVGIPLSETLQTLAIQYRGPFRTVVQQLQDRVATGTSLSQAMRQQPAVFDEICWSITEVGENAGNLDVVLDRLAEFKERAVALRGRIVTALIYPCIVLIVAIAVSVLLMTFVVPKLIAPLVEAGRPIPLPTRIVKAASDGILGYWWVLLLGAAAISIGISALLATERGRRDFERALLRVPLLGGALQKQNIARLAIVMSTLLRGGVVFVTALQVARRTTGNLLVRDALDEIRDAVGSGSDIAVAMERTRAFPPMVVQIFAVGQHSGRLEEMLDRLAADYDRQVATLTQRLSAVLEPTLILFMVVIVGFIALATILPMLQAADVF